MVFLIDALEEEILLFNILGITFVIKSCLISFFSNWSSKELELAMMRKRMEVSGMVICSSLGVDKMYTLATTNKIIIIFFIKNHPTLY